MVYAEWRGTRVLGTLLTPVSQCLWFYVSHWRGDPRVQDAPSIQLWEELDYIAGNGHAQTNAWRPFRVAARGWVVIRRADLPPGFLDDLDLPAPEDHKRWREWRNRNPGRWLDSMCNTDFEGEAYDDIPAFLALLGLRLD